MQNVETEKFENFISQKGHELRCYKGHIYRRNGSSRLGERWRCTVTGCTGKLFTANNTPVKTVAHSHDEQWNEIQILRLKKNLHDATVATNERPFDIVAQCLAAGTVVGCRIPTVATLRDNITRKRKLLHILPSDEYEDIPDIYQKTLKGKPFIIYKDRPDRADRIVIFADSDGLKLLDDADTWIGDGTFYSSPKPFYQVYTIGISLFGKFYPIVFGLLSNKSQQTYIRFLLEVAKHVDVSKSRRVMLDFEHAMINSFRCVFPRSIVKCCYFHLCQAVWRKFSRQHSAAVVGADNELRLAFRMLLAIAFVPLPNVKQEFRKFKAYCIAEESLGKKMVDIIDYFDNTCRNAASAPGRDPTNKE